MTGALQAGLAERLGSDAEARWMIAEAAARAPGRTGDAVRDLLEPMVRRRLTGEPLQYVLGSWAFRTLELRVDRRALIPRPETEQVVEVALAELRDMAPVPVAGGGGGGGGGGAGGRGPVVIDMGTGTGAIALSIAVELCAARLEVWATDASPGALALAEENRSLVGATCPAAAERVRLRHGVWFDALPTALAGGAHLVVSNPPYVSEEEWTTLDVEVRQEPRQALVAGPGSDGTPGLAGVEAVLAGARRWLVPGGAVVVELAPRQADAATSLALRLGYRGVRVVPDLAGRERAIVGHR